MKNIHILPTDKPSIISKNSNCLSLTTVSTKQIRVAGVDNYINQNIYISSDEEIKESDYIKDKWVISEYGFVVKADRIEGAYLIHSNGGSNFLHHYKFIILTTDQDLIKDGVQAIDDEFLEWFVENSICEEICVNKIESFNFEMDKYIYDYKIIIPKEEPKKTDWVFEISSGYNGYRNKLTGSWIYESEYISFFNKPKQETLDDARREYVSDINCGFYSEQINDTIKAFSSDAFEQGAKWQQEQDKNLYSEDVVEIIANEMVCWAIANVGNQNPKSGKKFDEVIAKYKRK